MNKQEYYEEKIAVFLEKHPQYSMTAFFHGHIEDIDFENKIAYVFLYDFYENENLTAEIPLDKFPNDPLYPILKPGNIFFLYVISKEDNYLNQIEMLQETYSEEEINNAKIKGVELARNLKKIIENDVN